MIDLFTENRNINLIIKTAGNACNINCEYCFEQAKSVAHEAITPEMLKSLIEGIKNNCSVVFHGGEPLIVGKKKFSELLDVIRDYYPNKIIAVRIQTNGTLLDEEWIDLIFEQYKELEIEIAISLDGTEIMNSHRVDYNGNNTFTKVVQAYRLLEKKEISAGMLSVISKKSLPYYREYIDMIREIPNVRFVKINALFNVENNKLTGDSITPMEYADFIEKSAFYYIQTGLYRKIAIEPLLSIIQIINGKESKYCNYSKRKCFNYISVYPDGKIGPCDCFSVNEFAISTVNELNEKSSLEQHIQQSLKNENEAVLQQIICECDECDIHDFCNGGCISQRYYFRNNIELKKEFCESKHKLYECFKKLKL